jgi:peptide/nickel transport system ATP-binding protein
MVIAAALLTDAPLLLLDDALAGLDATLEMQIAELLVETASQQGKSLVFVSHDPLLVEHVSDRVYFVQDGNVMPSSEGGEEWATYRSLVSLQE